MRNSSDGDECLSKCLNTSLVYIIQLGNDTPSSPYNCFAVEALDLMGKFSQLAKAKGYFVAMAPAGKLNIACT